MLAVLIVGSVFLIFKLMEKPTPPDPLAAIHITTDAGYNEANKEAYEFGQVVFPKLASNEALTETDIDYLEKMIRLYDGMIAYRPGNPLPNLTAGESFLILRKYPEAAQRLRQFLVSTEGATDPKMKIAQGDAHFLLSQTLFAQKTYQDSLKEINDALAIDGKVSDYWTQKASVLLQLEQFHQSIDAAKTALKLNPQDGHAKGIIAIAKMAESDQAKKAKSGSGTSPAAPPAAGG